MPEYVSHTNNTAENARLVVTMVDTNFGEIEAVVVDNDDFNELVSAICAIVLSDMLKQAEPSDALKFSTAIDTAEKTGFVHWVAATTLVAIKQGLLQHPPVNVS